jgi:hypothetical protein
MKKKLFSPINEESVIRQMIRGTYRYHPHAFIKGSGQETMMYWNVLHKPGKSVLQEENMPWPSPRRIRATLNRMVDEGLMEKGQSNTGYTTFLFLEEKQNQKS